LYMYSAEMNACTRIIYFLYTMPLMYSFYCFILCVPTLRGH